MKATTILLLLSPVWAEWNIIFYSEPDCGGKILGHESIAASGDSSCHRAQALPEGVRSAKYSDRDGRDDGLYIIDDVRQHVRFYDTDDCSHHCSHRHAFPGHRYKKCVTFPSAADEPTRTMRSFNIVDELRGNRYSEGVLADGYCTFAHGDTLFFNGREWRMHQVAAAYFHEIPAEDWDDELHTPNATHRAAEHGDVDIYAQYKMWQMEDRYLDQVPLESWNVTKHVKRGKQYYTAERYNDAVDSLCMETTSFKTEADFVALAKGVPNWEAVCSGKTFDEWAAMYGKVYGEQSSDEGVSSVVVIDSLPSASSVDLGQEPLTEG